LAARRSATARGAGRGGVSVAGAASARVKSAEGAAPASVDRPDARQALLDPDEPLISIVVPTFNVQARLAGLLDSLAEQTYRDFELIVSDGASQDGTVPLAEASAPRLPACRILSRRDRGVYDAINLGCAAARGRWILVLGGDDRLHGPETLALAASALRGATAAVVYGDVRMMSASADGVPAGARYAGPLPLAQLLRKNICQQAIFYRRELLAELGGFDLRYPVLADWELNLRAAFRAPMQWVDLVVADYAATGLSTRVQDPAAARGFAELVRTELLRRRHDRSLWPLHRALLRQADACRRRGLWAQAFKQLGSYAWLGIVRGAQMFRGA
jgi:glycosyltransferase involved in cell wall biosynthesis